MERDHFIGQNLIKIRERLTEATENSLKHTDADSAKAGAAGTPIVSPAPSSTDKEWNKAIDKRWDEFRMLKRDYTGRLAESLAALPEEIKLSRERTEELQRAIEKFAHLLDEAATLDDSKWNRSNLAADLGTAMRKMENIRLEYLRITSKLKALQRETDAAESGSNSSIFPDLNSVSWVQGFRLGLVFLLPLIIGFIVTGIIVAIALLLAMRP